MSTLAIACSYIVDPSRDYVWSMSHVLTFNGLATPLMLALTYGFVTLREEDTDWWQRALLEDGVYKLALGLVLGGMVYVTVGSTAAALGWVHFPEWGWHRASKPAVAWTLISHLANLSVAWNEEMLYRGYGLHSLSKAFGLPVAVAILIPLFARSHGTGWQVFIGQSALGLATTALRLTGDSLWLPVGYHAAWNYVQTAVLGPPDASPSLLPMHVEGPKLWMGRPGYPEPGLLATLANLVVATGALFLWWRSRRQALRYAD